MPEYIAYPNVADIRYVRDAPAEFPRRATKEEAAEDSRNAWHKRGHVLTIYEIDDDAVTKREAKLHRVLEIH